MQPPLRIASSVAVVAALVFCVPSATATTSHSPLPSFTAIDEPMRSVAPPASEVKPVAETVAFRTATDPTRWQRAIAPATAGGLRMVRSRPGVIDAALVYERSASKIDSTPNDPLWRSGQQGWLDAVHLRQAWKSAGRLASVKVAVLDSGIDLGNSEFSGRLLKRNGKVVGKDFIDGGSPQDKNGHGTEVSGVIAAAPNNRTGTVGGAPNVRILPVRVLNARGRGTDLQVAKGIRWAVNHGAQVLNMSLGGGKYGRVLADAIAYAIRRGRVVIAASGNDPLVRWAGTSVYPAALPGVISVGASDNAGRLAEFSSTGDNLGLVAPGVGVRSIRLGGGTTTADGTSFSAPIVAATAALGRGKGWSAHKIRVRLCRSSHDIGSPGRDLFTGCGLLDARNFIRNDTSNPLPTAADDADDAFGDARTPLSGIVIGRLGDPGDVDWLQLPGTITSPTRVSVTLRSRGVSHPRSQADALAAYLVDGDGNVLDIEATSNIGGSITVAATTSTGPVRVRIFSQLSSGDSSYSVQWTLQTSSGTTTPKGSLIVDTVTPSSDRTGVSRTAPITVRVLGSQPVNVRLIRTDGPTDVVVASSSSRVGQLITVTPDASLPAKTPIAIRIRYTEGGKRFKKTVSSFRTS